MVLFTFIDIQRWRVYFYNIKLVLDYINKFITVKYSYVNVLIC